MRVRRDGPDAGLPIAGVVQPGHRVASGLALDSPYPAGTIALQTPHFRERGLDLRPYYPGTLNVSIAPNQFQLRQPDYTFAAVTWLAGFDAETFSFVAGQLIWRSHSHNCLLYYPHPETKINHFQNPSIMEILAPKIAGIAYGETVELRFPAATIVFTR